MRDHVIHILSAFILAAMWGCSNEPSRGAQPTNGAKILTFDEELAVKLKRENELAADRAFKRDQLEILKAVNAKYCLRLFRYRQECAVSARVVPDTANRVLGCVSNVDDQAKMQNNFIVRINSATGRFKLDADDYESDEFDANRDVLLTWKSKGDTGTLAPRLSELNNLTLKRVDRQPIGAPAALGFELKVNSTVVLKGTDLAPIADAQSTLKVDLTAIIEQRKTEKCRVPDAELDTLADEAKKEVASRNTSATPANVALALAVSASSAQVEEQKRILAEKQALIERLEGEIKPLSVSYENEMDRNGKLRRELKGDMGAGCWSRQKISKLEILIKGEHRPSIQRHSGEEKARQDEGSPAQIKFQFGDTLTHIHSNEEQQAVITAQGRIQSTEHGARRVGDMEFVDITKGGVGWEAQEYARNCGFLSLGSCRRFNNFERNIYRVDGIVIKVNDQEFYKNDNVNFTFQRGTLKWRDQNIQLNPAFIALMQRTDCPQGQ